MSQVGPQEPKTKRRRRPWKVAYNRFCLQTLHKNLYGLRLPFVKAVDSPGGRQIMRRPDKLDIALICILMLAVGDKADTVLKIIFAILD